MPTNNTAIIIMLAIALILLAAGLVLYPSLIVAIRSMNLSTTQSVTTHNPCTSGFESFEGTCYKVVKVTDAPDEKSCNTKDPTIPPSVLAHVNNETAIVRVQRYINYKDVPGNYYINLFCHMAGTSLKLATSSGVGLEDYAVGLATFLDPYFNNQASFMAAVNLAQMKYFGGQKIFETSASVKDSLLCEAA